MAETATGGITAAKTPKSDAPRPPLTVAEIIAFEVPPNLRGWKVTQDTIGGYSFRAHIGGFRYIAIPDAWEGRTLTASLPGGIPMEKYAINGVTDINSQAEGTMETNDPSISRNLIPASPVVESGTSCPAPDPYPNSAAPNHTLTAGLIAVAVVVTFLVTSALAGLLYFIAGRRTNGAA